jgi:hypothetical protein
MTITHAVRAERAEEYFSFDRIVSTSSPLTEHLK